MRKRRWLELDGDGDGDDAGDHKRRKTDDLVLRLADSEVGMRSLGVSGLIAGAGAGAGRVRDALLQRLSEEQDVFLVQQIITALASVSGGGDEHSTTVSCLERYYLLDGCPEAIKLWILSSLVRICESREEHFRVLESLGSVLRTDLHGKNPMLRMWILKLVFKFFSRQASGGWIAALRRRFSDTHACVRGAALDAAIALGSTGFGLLDGLHGIALELLQDQAIESVRLSALELLRLWAIDAQAGESTPSLEREINYTFLQICVLLTDPSIRARKQACLVLGSMRSVSQKVKLHSVSKKSMLVARGDALIASKINGKEPPTAMVAGAFVSAVEDEFPEVRSAAVQALTSLGRGCKELVDAGVLALFLDMLNDRDSTVRETTIRAIHELACGGVVCVEHKTLSVISASLEDQNEELRHAGFKLLSALKLPATVLFESAVQTLVDCLDRHSEDEKNIYEALLSLANAHDYHVEALNSDLATQIKKGLDTSRLGVLVAHIRLIVDGEKGVEDHNLNLDVTKLKFSPDRIAYKRHSIEADDAAVLIIVQRVIKCALQSGNFSKYDQRATIRGCRKSLQALEKTPLVNLGLLYVDCMAMVAESKSAKLECDLDKLGLILGRLELCFSAFSDIASLQLLELNVFYAVSQLDENTNIVKLFAQLRSIVERSKRFSSTSIEHLLLLRAAEESLRNLPDSNSVSNLRAAAASFWPKHDIVSAGIKEMRSDLTLPWSSFEQRLKVVMPTFPYHFSVGGAVHNIRTGSRIWIQMELEGFPKQYRFLDLKTESGGQNPMEFTQELDFYNMPSITKAVLRVCVAVELTRSETFTGRGPQACLAPISPERLLYLDQC